MPKETPSQMQFVPKPTNHIQGGQQQITNNVQAVQDINVQPVQFAPFEQEVRNVVNLKI